MKTPIRVQNYHTGATSAIYTGSNRSAGVRLERRTAAGEEVLTEAYTSSSTSFSIFSYSSLFSPPSSSILASPSFSFGFRFFIPGQIITQLVGLFVDAACPSSSLEATKIYGIECSSLKPGRCEMMSIGLISAARIRILVRVVQQCPITSWVQELSLPLFAFSDTFYNLLHSALYLPTPRRYLRMLQQHHT